jgi:hypothetical protein
VVAFAWPLAFDFAFGLLALFVELYWHLALPFPALHTL